MFDEIQSSAAAKTGGWFDSVFKVIGQVLPMAGSLFGGGGSSTPNQARGLAAIQQKSQQVLSALDGILAQVGQGNYQQLYGQAQQLVAALSDPNEFYQAQKGDDAAALANAKTQANAKLQAIAAKGAQVSATTTLPNQAGQVVSAGGSFTQRLLENDTLLYVGVGLAAMYMLTRRDR